MEARRSEILGHVSRVAQALTRVCKLPGGGPVLHDQEVDRGIVVSLTNSHALASHVRTVTTGLGRQELVVALPIDRFPEPRYWIGIHENWSFVSKTKLRFVDCGMRVYTGVRSEVALQFLRLEWVARKLDPTGALVFDGAHAAHPHWHVDRPALVGREEFWQALELLTAPTDDDAPLETFDPSIELGAGRRPSRIEDFSWLSGIHLPAQMGWMHSPWDGAVVPGPHQVEPQGIDMLSSWWEGVLPYIAAELRTHVE